MTRAAAVAALLALLAPQGSAAPRDPPPADWPGDAWIDATGCAFQRAEIGAATVWADRLDADGAPLCGFPPSDGVTGSAAVTEVPPQRRGQTPDFPAPGRYIQIAAFRDTVRADALATELHLRGLKLLRQDFTRARLRILHAGPVGDETSAAEALAGIRAMGYADAFVWIVEQP